MPHKGFFVNDPNEIERLILADRTERARQAAKARTGTDYHIKKLVEAAPSLTTDQIEKLRALLPMEDGQ